jgi:hypothetical protein
MLKGKFKRESMYDPVLFFPKALNIKKYGRSSDLSRFYEAFPSHLKVTVAGFSKIIIV